MAHQCVELQEVQEGPTGPIQGTLVTVLGDPGRLFRTRETRKAHSIRTSTGLHMGVQLPWPVRLGLEEHAKRQTLPALCPGGFLPGVPHA